MLVNCTVSPVRALRPGTFSRDGRIGDGVRDEMGNPVRLLGDLVGDGARFKPAACTSALNAVQSSLAPPPDTPFDDAKGPGGGANAQCDCTAENEGCIRPSLAVVADGGMDDVLAIRPNDLEAMLASPP